MNLEEIPGRFKLGVDALRLGLADLRTQLLAKRVVLDIHDAGLCGAVVDGKAEAIEVPLPPGTCRLGQPHEIEAIGDLIGDLFLELGLPGAKVSACLPLQASRWKVVRWPQGLMPESGCTELRLRAPDLGIPWPLSDVYLAVAPLPGTPARSLVVASPRKLVDGWVEVFELAGVRLQRLLSAQACQWQLLAATAPATQAEERWLLELERSRSRLWLVADGRPIADWALPGQCRSNGLDPKLADALRLFRQFWQQHNPSNAPQSWWLYGADDQVAAAEPDLQQLLPAGALQRWQPGPIRAHALHGLDMTAGDLDLLRERRALLGIPEPDTSPPLVPLLKGAVLGGALVGAALVASGLMALLNRSTTAEVERLAPVQGRLEALQAQIKAERSQRLAIEKASTDLAQALVAVRSGSALMEDLRRRAPQGVQFTEARVEAEQLRLKGMASAPDAFARINALQLTLARSPLLNPKTVRLIKANRDELKTAPPPGSPVVIPPVLFELTAGFKPRADGADLATLRMLGANGMAMRLQKLQREGLLR